MKIFKFGGASVNSAEAVKNMAEIVRDHYSGSMILVFSAMGKTTNALEEVVAAGFEKDGKALDKLEEIQRFHRQIAEALFDDVFPEVLHEIEVLFEQLSAITDTPSDDYDAYYDAIVPFGEKLSCMIANRYLSSVGLANAYVDAQTFLITDGRFRHAAVNWDETCKRIRGVFGSVRQPGSGSRLFVTEGFIGSTPDGHSTTLGREGSDFTASLLAYCLDAEEVVVWKDVAGLMNADPVCFADAVRVERLSYGETIELAYYGAKILHPKTIKPLQNKNIPLRIKSFFQPGQPGSLIAGNVDSDQPVPFFILKHNQVLVSFRSRDFSFVTEKRLQKFFEVFNQMDIKINLMQNSAISFTVCINHPGEKLQRLIKQLSDDFEVFYNEGLELLTIRHFNEEVIGKYLAGRKILLEQRSRKTYQAAYLKK
jgi:aspartate kinase